MATTDDDTVAVSREEEESAATKTKTVRIISAQDDVLVERPATQASPTRGSPRHNSPKSPSRRSPSPRARSPRDSIAKRLSPGLPGSRRHHRFLNNFALMESAFSDPESDEEIEYNLTIEWKSGFEIIFEDEVVRQKWEPFIEISEEHQEKLLESYYRPSRRGRGKSGFAYPVLPSACFSQLHKVQKRILLKYKDNPFITRLDSQLTNYIQSPHSATLKLTFERSFLRLLCHCICAYYSLQANSMFKNGEQVTCISKPKGIKLPQSSISEYLQTISER